MNKALHRKLRFTAVVELAARYVRRTNVIPFPELGIEITAGPGDVIIDCGANVGWLTSRFARTGATVHAFEPNPMCYRIIKRRFAALGNVTCHNQGVMDKACTLTLETPVAYENFDTLDVTVSSSFVNKSHPVPIEGVEVECIDLADFISELGKPIKLLKMDIEGAEVAVLNHLLDRGMMDRIGLAVVETHERFSEELARGTEALKDRIAREGFESRVRLDWV
jgi:FkbM family methyltransferase